MQNPLGMTQVALIIISKQGGTGKNLFANVIEKLNGDRGKTANNISNIAG